MRKGVFNAAATDTKSENSRFLGMIVHTGPQRSYSSRHETDHLLLIELPAHVIFSLVAGNQKKKKYKQTCRHRGFLRTYILVANPRDSFGSFILAARFKDLTSRCTFVKRK